MILYSGSGAGDFELLGDASGFDEAVSVASELLRARGQEDALAFMEEYALRLYEGTNHFGDEFKVLSGEAAAARYVELEQSHTEARTYADQLVRAFDDAGVYVRFLEVRPNASSNLIFVQTPTLVGASWTVERAILDADQRLQASALASVDRLHTAFKGYLRQIASDEGIMVPEDAELPAVFRALRTTHPALVAAGPGAAHITRIINAMATIVDALSPLRNDNSLAHENDDLLREPEAALYVNAVRTLFSYVQARLSGRTPLPTADQ